MHKLRILLDTGAASPSLLTFESHQRPTCHGYVEPLPLPPPLSPPPPRHFTGGGCSFGTEIEQSKPRLLASRRDKTHHDLQKKHDAIYSNKINIMKLGSRQRASPMFKQRNAEPKNKGTRQFKVDGIGKECSMTFKDKKTFCVERQNGL